MSANIAIFTHPLSAATQQNLEHQRSYVANLAEQHFPGAKLSQTQADLLILQNLIELNLIAKEDTWELQALGVVFGDALIDMIAGMAWWEVTDEYGTDPVLRYRQTTLQIGARTMIAKRIESDEEVDVLHMAAWLQDFVREKAGEYQ